MHRKALAALSPSTCHISTPRCYRYVKAEDDDWWEGQLHRFPPAFRISCNALVSNRMPPFPKLIREKIIDFFCPAPLISTIKASEPDQDCIIRPYLSRRRLQKPSRFQAFSLRNYPLQMDQIELLELDGAKLARTMAETLATLYWSAHIDENDAEFALAPHLPGCSNEMIPSSVLGDHTLWILDFDCCRDMPQNHSGVEQAVRSFYRNDPYFPRPGSDGNNRQLWRMFKDSFLEASLAFMGGDLMLPKLWVQLVEDNADPKIRRAFLNELVV
jgi:hypothetical protein